MSHSLAYVIKEAINTALLDVHTALPAKITKVNSTTINVKPVINRVFDGNSIELPEFIEVPPLFLHGGASYLAHPLSVGDYCLLIVSERCLDDWYKGGDYLPPRERRFFDYSDCIALVGINPESKAITIPSVVQMTGNTNQDGDYTHQGDRTQTGNYNLTGDQVINGNLTVNGNISVNGNITVTGTIAAGNFAGLNGQAMSSNTEIKTTKDVIAGNISLKAHKHIEGDGKITGEPIS